MHTFMKEKGKKSQLLPKKKAFLFELCVVYRRGARRGFNMVLSTAPDYAAGRWYAHIGVARQK